MVCASVHGADGWCWHVPFALWALGNGLISLGHDLHFSMHPFQAPQSPLDGPVLGWFGKNAQDRSDTLWCVRLSMELMVGSIMLYLTSWCVAMCWQAWGMTSMSEHTSFRLHSGQQMGWFLADLAKRS